jgi:D-tyrosyl-tRNA(Tyr) deacylase
MLCVLQRVKSGSVSVIHSSEKQQISEGLVIFIGVQKGDTEGDILALVEKIVKLRVFQDKTTNKEFDKSIEDINGEVLVVPEFTLLGDCSKGRRPEFILAENYQQAKVLYDKFVHLLRQKLHGGDMRVKEGVFGAEMLVEIHNVGPVTFILNTRGSNK